MIEDEIGSISYVMVKEVKWRALVTTAVHW
jgi:hypothetical protein